MPIRFPSIRPAVAAALAAAAVSACATAPYSTGPAPATAFDAEAFAWSQRGGQAAIEGRIAYRQDGQSYNCLASAGLTPDTPYTRARFQTLYGSTESAAVPAAVVRARDVGEAGADYRAYVRSEPCENGRFRFSGLPDGGWFLIVPVSAGDAPLVLMRHVDTRGGRVVNITL